MTPFVLISGDFVTTGGMDRANYALATHLAHQGYPVHLVAHRAAADLLAQPTVHLHRVPKPARSYFLSSPLLDWLGRHWAAKLARQGGRVVVNGGSCRFGDVNWVHYLHRGFPPDGHGGLRQRLKRQLIYRVWHRAERRTLVLARVIIANSEKTRQGLLTWFDLDPKRIQVVYYGTDPNLFAPVSPDERAAARRQFGWEPQRRLACFVGALGDQRKGFDTLFAAWQKLCGQGDWDCDLMVIGAGSEVPVWKVRAEAAGLAGRIHILGFRADVPQLLRACDLLVSPTRYEPYGMNVHEALSCALPTFVSASAGVAERYPPELQHLLLPDPEDADDLARRLQAWRADPERDRPALLRLSETLRSYTWTHMAEAMLQHIAAVG